MKYLKLLLLPLLAGCALAQTTPISNPTLYGTVTFSTSPSVTNGLTYVDASNHLQPLTLGAGLTLSGGVLTSNNSGGGGGGNIFTQLQVGADTATSSIPINFSPLATANGNLAKAFRLSPTINNTAANDTLYGIATGGTIQALTPYTNVNYTHELIGTPTLTGYVSLNSATAIYISPSPAATNKYGIVQAGPNDLNTFAGKVSFADGSYISSSGPYFQSNVTLANTLNVNSAVNANNLNIQGNATLSFVGPTSYAITTNSGYPYGSINISPYATAGNTGILYTTNTGVLSTVNIGSGLSFSGGTLTNTGGGGGGGVSQIIAGTGIAISPTGGTGAVTITASGTSGVTSATGTSNQILVNGTTGSAQTGAVTLTTPQNIDTGANVQFNSLSIGVAYASNIGVDLQPTVVSGGSGGGGAKGVRASASILANGNNDTIYSEAAGGIIAVGSFTGINYYEKFVGAPTFQSGSGNVYNAVQLYLAGFGTPGVTLTNKYGIYQGGTETNVFKGIVVLPHSTVSALPSASTVQYGEAFVSDATQAPGTSIGSTPSGGGSYIRKVYSDGTNWLLE